MRISIPYFLRSPAYRATIRRRLSGPVHVVPASSPTIISAKLAREIADREAIPDLPWAKSSRRYLELEAEQKYMRGTHVFVEGPRLLRSPRARWWLSPAFFAGIASILVGVVLALLERAAP